MNGIRKGGGDVSDCVRANILQKPENVYFSDVNTA